MALRLMYVINSFVSGGAELGLLTLVKRGVFENFDLQVVALAKGDGNLYRELVGLLGSDKVISLAQDRAVKDYKLPSFIFALAKAYHRFQPQVVILSLPQAVFCGRLASLFYRPVKRIIFEHNVERQRKIADFLLYYTSGLSDCIFGDSAATLVACRNPYLMSLPSLEVPLTVLQPGLPRALNKQTPIRLLSIGRLEKAKNFGALIDAIALLKNQGFAVELRLAGKGSQYQRLCQQVLDLNLAKEVHLLGYVESLEQLLQQSDIYLQPSLTEGLAIAVLEAMAAGMIIVASNVGAIKDYGVDRKNMFKLSDSTAAAIAETLREAIDRFEQLVPMSKQAQATITQYYTPEAIWPKWEAAQLVIEQLAQA